MLHHMATILVCYGGHFESKMAAKIQKSSAPFLFPWQLLQSLSNQFRFFWLISFH
jgi:hypothetical protein